MRDAHIVDARDQLLQIRQQHAPSVLEDRATGDGRIDAETLELAVAPRATGLQPYLVQAQDVGIRARPVPLAHLVERIDHWLELARQLTEYAGECPAARMPGRVRQRVVGTTAHGDVVVDVDQLAREAVGKEPGDEKRHVAKALQGAVLMGGIGWRLERLTQHRREWL